MSAFLDGLDTALLACIALIFVLMVARVLSALTILRRDNISIMRRLDSLGILLSAMHAGLSPEEYEEKVELLNQRIKEHIDFEQIAEQARARHWWQRRRRGSLPIPPKEPGVSRWHTHNKGEA